MSLEENQKREIERNMRTSEDRLRSTLRGEIKEEQRIFRGEMRVMFVVFLAAGQVMQHAAVGLEVAGVSAGTVAALHLVPRFLNR